MNQKELEVLEYTLHRIDIKASKLELLAVDGSAEDLESYAQHIIDELFSSSRARQFKFTSMNELVASSLVKIFNGEEWAGKSSEIAEKLFEVEKNTQDRIKQLGTVIKKGGLLQLKLNHDNKTKFVITKIDDDDFFDENDLKLKSGLPTSKTRLQKAAIATFETDGSLSELILSDSKTTITEYWYLYFLSAEQLTDSETNTKNAFNAIDQLLNKEVKKVSPIDYWFIRNDVVNYFRNEDSLTYDTLVDRINLHQPESEEFKTKFDGFIKKLEALPNKKGANFDTQFDIDPGVIKARIIKKVLLDENFELRFKGEVTDLKTRIYPGKDQKGKFIKIYSDKGYEEFSTLEEKNNGAD